MNDMMRALGFIEVTEGVFRRTGRQRGYYITEQDGKYKAERIRFIQGTYKLAGKRFKAGTVEELEVLIENDRSFWNLGAKAPGEEELPKYNMSGAEEQARNRLLSDLVEKLQSVQDGKHVCAWMQPWSGGPRLPVNWETGKPYSGINLFLLKPGEYIPTGKLIKMQENDESIKVLRDRTYPILFASPVKDNDDSDNNDDCVEEHAARWIKRTYRLRSIVDLEGVKTKFKTQLREHTINEKTEMADKMIREYTEVNDILLIESINQNEAFLRPSERAVYIPAREKFEKIDEYYSTVFHELIHSTGILLNRPLSGMMQTDPYAKEELIAEMGAAILCQALGFTDAGTRDNTNEYLLGWYSKIKAEKASYAVSAASQASKAADLILKYKEEIITALSPIYPIPYPCSNLTDSVQAA